MQAAVAADPVNWLDANQAFVIASMGVARARLQVAPDQVAPALDPALAELKAAEAKLPAPAALQRIRARFELSRFEYELLVLCASVELATEVGDACARLHGDVRRRWPSFGLACATLPDAHWSALSPDRPLRRFRLLQLLPGSFSEAMLQVEERVLQEIVGLPCLDVRLRGLIALPEVAWLPKRFAAVLTEITSCLSRSRAPVMLTGGGTVIRRSLAAAALQQLGLVPLLLRAGDVAVEPTEREALFALVRRELLLRGGGLILEVKEDDPVQRVLAALAVGREESTPIVVSSLRGETSTELQAIRIPVPATDAVGQRALWREVFQESAESMAPVIEELAEEFRIDPDEIFTLGSEWRLRASAGIAADAATSEHPLRLAARSGNRGRFAGVAQVIVPQARPDDLVLPAPQSETIRQIEQHVCHRKTVLGDWGFSLRDGRGLGITALFHGASGTGKTLAAEVIAARLRLDLVRVDLSQTVSKYIGETEKNLGRVFDAADRGGVVLLFDEADALFGKRSDIKNSHDRYANIEVGYLLQRMESFRGLAILTTNLRQALDTAFLRRLRFVVAFPFPDVGQRAEIWRRVLPAEMPRVDVDVERLARLNVSGGNIRNIALHAAYLAADEGTAVGMRHLLRAAKDECQRMEKSVTQSEIGGWVA